MCVFRFVISPIVFSVVYFRFSFTELHVSRVCFSDVYFPIWVFFRTVFSNLYFSDLCLPMCIFPICIFRLVFSEVYFPICIFPNCILLICISRSVFLGCVFYWFVFFRCVCSDWYFPICIFQFRFLDFPWLEFSDLYSPISISRIVLYSTCIFWFVYFCFSVYISDEYFSNCVLSFQSVCVCVFVCIYDLYFPIL